MSKSNTLENEILAHLFQNAAIAGIGDATGLPASATAGSCYVSLHTADPAEGGDQTSNEATYTGYARAAVARSAAGWDVVGNAAANAAEVAHPQCTGGGPQTITHFGIGTSPSGAGKLLYSGALSSSLVVNAGITPTWDAGELDVTED